MDDTRYIEEMSGTNGVMASAVKTCHSVNSKLTDMMDALEGPDAIDAFDASCNTCKHFQRTVFDRKERLVSIWGFPGTCAKTGDSVTGWPRGQYCGHVCYENRRTGAPSYQSMKSTDHFDRP